LNDGFFYVTFMGYDGVLSCRASFVFFQVYLNLEYSAKIQVTGASSLEPVHCLASRGFLRVFLLSKETRARHNSKRYASAR
jgi:hypothetical protein